MRCLIKKVRNVEQPNGGRMFPAGRCLRKKGWIRRSIEKTGEKMAKYMENTKDQISGHERRGDGVSKFEKGVNRKVDL
jgi:hypothetical protein